MSDIESRAIRKRVLLRSQFTQPVLIEEVSVHGDTALARVRRSDGGLDDVTIDLQELEDALAREISAGPQLADGASVFNALEAARIRLAFHYDPYFAVSLSGVRALPHQLEAVYERLLPQPRLRFVLAHDPGAGKTIMAGLLIKELKLRGAAERVLILVPSPLAPQWQDELYEKFDETFELVDSHVETGQVAGNVWQRRTQCIASIDYAKRDASDYPDSPQRSVRDALLQCSWDLVIIDEAHKASAAIYGDEVKPTKRYRLIEELARSPHVHHMLFLTATPHQGKEEQFRLFLRLLDPDQFEAQDFEQVRRLLAEDRCPFFMRRVKEELRDFDGRKLFLPRNSWTQDFMLSGAEWALYQDITHYIQEYLGRTFTGRRRMAVALARTVLLRRLASSLHAITESLRRRMERLTTLLTEVVRLPPAERERRLRAAGLIGLDEEADDDDRGEAESDRTASEFTVADTVEGLRREVAELRRLHASAAALRDLGREEKLDALKRCLDRAEFTELREGNGKLLIFTEHRDTLEHLERNLKSWGYSVVTIHGEHSPLDRKERRRRFDVEDQICIATDAAGEGVNLQFCHLMINYDVPWNPNRLEQRMGRIHRIGQGREVHVFNFVAVNTVEGRVLHTLLEKVKVIKNDLQTDRIFDVIGTFLRAENLNVEDVLREAAVNPRRADDFIRDVERLSAQELQRFEQATAVALARKELDLSHLHRRSTLHEDVRLMPEYVERFFLEAARATDLTVEQRADGLLRVPGVASRFRSPGLRAVQRHGAPRDRYLKATFRKEQRVGRNEDADLISPGHPLYASVVELFEAKLGSVEGATALFVDPRAERPYFIHAFEVGVVGESAGLDARTTRAEPIDARFVLVTEREVGSFELVSQDLLHDLTPVALADAERVAPTQAGTEWEIAPVGAERARAAATWLRLHVQHAMVRDAKRLRGEDARIRREYLTRAFEAMEHRLREAEIPLHAAVEAGEQGAAGRLTRLQDEIQQTELRRDERFKSIDRLAVARAGDVRHLATVVVAPLPVEDAEVQAAMRFDPEVERVAMEFVMAEERRRGWEPEDVSQLLDGRGYDILSWGPTEDGKRSVRRIEVKGRSTPSGDVALTRNEWIKAERLGADYWLYVVYNAVPGGVPRLVTVRDPARSLADASTPLSVIKAYLIAGSAIAKMAT